MKPITIDLGDQWIRNNLIKIEKTKETQERCLLAVLNDYFSNYSELLQSSRSAKLWEINILQKRQFL